LSWCHSSVLLSRAFRSFLQCSARHRALHSLPTRRSSDLLIAPHEIVTMINGQTGSPAGCWFSKVRFGIGMLENIRPIITETAIIDRKSTRLNSSHVSISYAVFCLKKKTHSGSVEHLAATK